MNLPISIPKIGEIPEVAKIISFVAPVAALIVAVAVIALVAWPKFTEVLKLRNSNEELTVKAAALADKADKLSTYDKVDLDFQLAAAEQLLPSNKDVFNFVAQVEGAARNSGVLLSKLDATVGVVSDSSEGESDKPTPTGSSTSNSAVSSNPDLMGPKVQLNISLVADYRAFLLFLNNIQTLNRAVAIRDLTVSGGASDQSSQVRVALVIDAFWQELPSELASIETPIDDLTPEEEELLAVVSSNPSTSSALPSVATGRSDLFAPF